jgi:hypothetical protein
MGVSNNCWKYLSWWGEWFSNVVKIFSCIIFEVNVSWTLIVKDGCSMCDGSTRLLHVNMSNCGFSCECCSRERVCGMSSRPTFVFVDVSMLFKQELIFFTIFTFCLWVSQPYFGQVWGWSPTLGKSWDWSPPGLPKIQKTI